MANFAPNLCRLVGTQRRDFHMRWEPARNSLMAPRAAAQINQLEAAARCQMGDDVWLHSKGRPVNLRRKFEMRETSRALNCKRKSTFAGEAILARSHGVGAKGALSMCAGLLSEVHACATHLNVLQFICCLHSSLLAHAHKA